MYRSEVYIEKEINLISIVYIVKKICERRSYPVKNIDGREIFDIAVKRRLK